MPIQTLHLRSSVQGKEPTPGSATGELPVGSIGINFNSAEPFLTIQDSAGNIRRIAGIKVAASAPATPTAGEAWLDTTLASKPVFKVYDGTAWQGTSSGATSGSTMPASPTQGDLWVDTSVSGSPVLKVYNGTVWAAVAPDATTSVKGLARLADTAAVTAGTAGRVVTADQLKATNDTLTTARTDITNLQTSVTTLQGQTVDATTTVKGIVQLADGAAVAAGTAGLVVTADQLKATNDTITNIPADVWSRVGTELSPATAGDSVSTTGAIQGADLTAANLTSATVVATDATGKLVAGSAAQYGDTTANFTGTLQNNGSDVVVDTDIGVTVQPYDVNTAKLNVAQTFTAVQTFTDPAIIGTILEDVYTITDGADFEIDPGNGSIQLVTLGNSRTPKSTNFANGEAITLMVDDGTGFALTWTDATFGGTGVIWKTDAGASPTLNTAGYTVVVLWKVAGQVYGARVGDN